jgi:protein tyrosine phosphatase (PTP) superfamily phosphohydrolase (DUF442 family)
MRTPREALTGVSNVAEPLPNLLTGGQPSAKHFEALKAAGLEVVLDIRDPMEPRPFDEAQLVQSLGMRYVNVPVVAGTLTDETLERLLGLIRENESRPTLLHCASGNRVWGPVIPRLVLDRGLTDEEAATIAMRGGLRGAEILEWGLDYTRRQRGGSLEKNSGAGS